MSKTTKQLSLFALVCLTALVGCDRTQLTKFNNGEVYSDATVNADEVTQLGDFLVESGFFDGGRKSVEITRDNGQLQFRMVVLDGYESDESYAELCGTFAGMLSEHVFDGEEVTMHLCDEYFETLRVINMTETADATASGDTADQDAAGADKQQVTN